MKKILLITILSLSCMATFAAKKNKISDKLKKEKQAKMVPPTQLSYTTSCGTTVTFTIASESMSDVGWVIDVINDIECGTTWYQDDLMDCPVA